MSNSYLLKSHPNKLLIHHLEGVASSSNSIFEEISGQISFEIMMPDLERSAYIIGSSHDIGKGTSFFQNYLTGRSITFDPLLKSHSMISSHYCSWVIMNDIHISDENRDFLAVAASLAIQGHHGYLKSPINYLTRLYDFINEKNLMSKQIDAFERINEVERITGILGLRSFVEFSYKWEEHYDSFRHILRKLTRSLAKRFKDFQQPYFIVNLLYSILLDADRMDAANMSRPKRIHLNSGTVRSFVESNLNTDSMSDDRSSDNININRFRNILFDYVDQAASNYRMNDKKKILTLTAPTGLGKTVTSLNFALALRTRIYLERRIVLRIVYVAPFISILDQNIEVFKEIFQDKAQSNLLLLHHHLAPTTYSKSTRDDQQLRQEHYSTSQSELLIQGWNAEIVVTTFVQFFYTIFGRHTSQLRRLDNLIGSIIILDEVQSIPFEYWGTVRSVLRFLSEKFNVMIIMMSATQPLIFNHEETDEIAPTEILNRLPQRVSFCTETKNSIRLPEFCEEAVKKIEEIQSESVLLELNTIQNAVQVYKALKSRLNKSSSSSRPFYFLSSQVIPIHRRPRIFQIREKLKQMQPLVLVSTQVIEAGVDLDFDIAIRDIGPIDSIVQTAGRCNRNGNKRTIDSQVFLYRIINDDGYEFAKYVYGSISIDIADSLLSDKITSIDELLKRYYKEMKRRRSSERSDIINDVISKLNYEKVEQNFNLIDKDYKEPVYVEFDDNAKKIWNEFVRLMDLSRPQRNHLLRLKHEMEQYMIGVSEQDIQEKGLVERYGIYKIPFDMIHASYDESIGFMH